MKLITAILSVLFCLSIQAQLVTYPGTLSTGMPHNDDYTVRVRIPGGAQGIPPTHPEIYNSFQFSFVPPRSNECQTQKL